MTFPYTPAIILCSYLHTHIPMSLVLSYRRDQNILRDEYRQKLHHIFNTYRLLQRLFSKRN